jgi:hypothetical protein
MVALVARRILTWVGLLLEVLGVLEGPEHLELVVHHVGPAVHTDRIGFGFVVRTGHTGFHTDCHIGRIVAGFHIGCHIDHTDLELVPVQTPVRPLGSHLELVLDYCSPARKSVILSRQVEEEQELRWSWKVQTFLQLWREQTQRLTREYPEYWRPQTLFRVFSRRHSLPVSFLLPLFLPSRHRRWVSIDTKHQLAMHPEMPWHILTKYRQKGPRHQTFWCLEP